jgi:hypothetical protein
MKRLKMIGIFFLTIAILLLLGEFIEMAFAIFLVVAIGTGVVGG